MNEKMTSYEWNTAQLVKEISQELEQLIYQLSQYGANAEGGVTRLLYTEEWLGAQKFLEEILENSGFQIYYDQVGNLYGRLEGKLKNEKAIVTGSHIDTVVNGGKYDGAYGIVAGIIALKLLKEKFGQPLRHVEVVSLCEEEGSRFPLTYWGSGNVTGFRNLSEKDAVRDHKGISLGEAMQKAGFGTHAYKRSRREDIACFLEMHIEQGMVLERIGNTIGIVENIVGQKRFTITVAGESNHAGTTPMAWRKDALEGASEMIQQLLNTARIWGPPLVATVGKINLDPNIGNVIPGRAEFTVDVRHSQYHKLNAFCESFTSNFQTIAKRRGLDLDIKMWMDEKPVYMNESLCLQAENVCKEEGISFMRMSSGAGHDAQMFQACCPTGLIFVPSKQGISHSPQEYSSLEDLATGVVVLSKMLYQLAYKEAIPDEKV